VRHPKSAVGIGGVASRWEKRRQDAGAT